jgi:hypothetical protein
MHRPESNPLNMALRTLWGAVADLRREHSALRATVPAEDEAASLELAASTRAFSRRTKDVVDDKLSFSATLMRAGEVDAANRLIVELERDVRGEGAALLERANEACSAGAARHARLTRARALRTLVAAALGTTLLATSAFGLTLAHAIRDEGDGRRPARSGARSSTAPNVAAAWEDQSHIRRVRVGDVEIPLTRSEFRRYKKLISGPVDDEKIAAFLRTVLPARLVPRVTRAIVAAIVPASDLPGAAGVRIDAPDLEEATDIAGHAEAAAEAARDGAGNQDESDGSSEPSGDEGGSGSTSRDRGGSREGSDDYEGEELGGGLPPLPGGI